MSFEELEVQNEYGNAEAESNDIDDKETANSNNNARVATKFPARQANPQLTNAQKQMLVNKIVNKTVKNYISNEEQKIDKVIDKLKHLSKDELEELREKRREQLKQKTEQRQKWLAESHGSIQTLQDEKQFFEKIKSTNLVVCMFFSKTSKWCTVMREHLQKLAQYHLECLMLEIDCESAPYLMEKLNIWMMPALLLAKNNKVDRQLMGLDWVAPDGIIDTMRLEKKLCEYGFFEEEFYALQMANPKNKIVDIDEIHKDIDFDEEDDIIN